MNKIDAIKLAEPVELMYADVQNALIVNIARHFKITDNMSRADWRVQKLSELGAVRKESAKIIADLTGRRKSAIEKALSKAAERAADETDAIVGAASRLGFISTASGDITTSAGVSNAVANYAAQAVDKTNLVNTVMLNSSISQFRWAVANIDNELGKARLKAIQAAFNTIEAGELQEKLAFAQRVLNQAAGEVILGTEAITTAVRQTVKALADRGITGFIDAAGHHWSPEAYVMMDVRTTVHNTAIEAQRSRSAEHGVSTFQITSHAGARPLCEPYQGGIYSWDGTSGVVYDLNDTPYNYEPIENTSYGEPAGIFGINCGHDPVTFVDGYSVPRYERTEDKEANDRLYQETQEQRALERSVRQAKTEAAAMKAAGDEEGFRKAAERVKAREARLNAFTKEHNLTERVYNTQVSGYNRSVAASVNAAAKRSQKELRQTIEAIKAASNGRMPNAISASTAQEKIKGYLLNSNHSVGKDKARVINSVLGYHQENWNILSDKVFDAVQTAEIDKIADTEYGIRYTVPVRITGEKGKSMVLNTVWQVDNGSNIPRFITSTFDKRTIREEN